MEESKRIGEITLGYGSESARKVEIKDMVRCEFADHRLVTIAHTDEDALLIIGRKSSKYRPCFPN
jgi:hypothetical protein